jgi:hypothetical protein
MPVFVKKLRMKTPWQEVAEARLEALAAAAADSEAAQAAIQAAALQAQEGAAQQVTLLDALSPFAVAVYFLTSPPGMWH